MTLSLVLLQEHPDVLLLLERPLASWSLAMDEHGGYEDLHGSGRRSIIPYAHGRTELYCTSLPCLNLIFFRPCEVASARAFYSSRSDSCNGSRGMTGGLGAGQTLYYRAQWLEVANDVLYGVSIVESSCLIALLH
jgi:hypothetical protein